MKKAFYFIILFISGLVGGQKMETPAASPPIKYSIPDAKINRQQSDDFKMFRLISYEREDKEVITFISLSDIIPPMGQSDSLGIFQPTWEDEKSASKYYKLNPGERRKFLTRVNLLEKDHVYIFDYALNKLLTFKIRDLDAVACLNVYEPEWPYLDSDYMIGFEVDQKHLHGANTYYPNTLVSIGNTNPFANEKFTNIRWKLIDRNEFPTMPINAKLLNELQQYFFKPLRFETGKAYRFEQKNFIFYVEDMTIIAEDPVPAKRLLVIGRKRGNRIFEKIYHESESASLASINEQWTGRLFKRKPHVIFGFEYFSFGCPIINYLDFNEEPVFINCDNRH